MYLCVDRETENQMEAWSLLWPQKREQTGEVGFRDAFGIRKLC